MLHTGRIDIYMKRRILPLYLNYDGISEHLYLVGVVMELYIYCVIGVEDEGLRLYCELRGVGLVYINCHSAGLAASITKTYKIREHLAYWCQSQV
jgi:hypothetical protein